MHLTFLWRTPGHNLCHDSYHLGEGISYVSMHFTTWNSITSESLQGACIDLWIAKENIVIHQCTGGLLHSYYNIIIINSLVLFEINSDIFKLSPWVRVMVSVIMASAAVLRFFLTSQPIQKIIIYHPVCKITIQF